MATQPFLIASDRYGPLFSNEQTPFSQRKINDITDLVGLQVHPVYLIGEFPYQAKPH